MSKEQTQKSDNELIAEFMGGRFYGPEDPDYANKWTFDPQPHKWFRKDAKHFTSGLNYHESWDWLMPVVEKIQKDVRAHLLDVDTWDRINRITDLPITTPLIEVYNEIVVFIKWYNSQPKP